MRTRTRCALTIALLLQAEVGVHADEKAEEAVRQRTRAFVAALASGKAEDVAAMFTSGGEYVRDGNAIRGREELAKAYGGFFKERKKGVQVEGESLGVRFPSEGTAIEEGRFVSKDGAPSSYSILWAQEDGEWRIALLRESADLPTLSDLDWLVGNWIVEGKAATVRTSYKKVQGGAFLRMEYTIESDGEKSTGSQMIGVDPETGTLRSWTFGAAGGLGTGTWSRTAKGWDVLSTGTTADGGSRAAVNVLTPVDENSFTSQATRQTIDGVPQPDGDVVKVVRATKK